MCGREGQSAHNRAHQSRVFTDPSVLFSYRSPGSRDASRGRAGGIIFRRNLNFGSSAARRDWRLLASLLPNPQKARGLCEEREGGGLQWPRPSAARTQTGVAAQGGKGENCPCVKQHRTGEELLDEGINKISKPLTNQNNPTPE